MSRVSQFVTQTFVIWMLIAAILGFTFPNFYTELSSFIPYLLGLIMFGMGLTIKPDDFKYVITAPKAVLIGVFLQYTIMPLIAWLLILIFQLPADLAIGVMLVGCSPGGTASNVISYLAKANVSLSVTITSISTLLAPLLTPLLMYVFMHETLQVSFLSMFKTVAQVIIIPIILGLLVQKLSKNIKHVTETLLPIVSVFAISLILAIVVASSRDKLFEVGAIIFLAVFLHNVLGYLLGYFLGNIFKLNNQDSRTVSIEVGMQNSGLATTLATLHFNPLAAIPGAVFSFIHCITGPILANWWDRSKHNIKKTET
ncbi:bile acid:sodium symporter family protein [Staphylococcus massiliensis]|uniref:Sodium-dependent transporter n=1 Tax=Staphylococcus massiliensis S46 TaxID=1229783 RepID=K9ANP3_9STAP|nr:bile acid:sodium symporter family protein [Staphylococcus massiliensis]EKU48998.1 sodium-dependent transporter [Staphylococcus massiliensis S46]MCG3399441.1 bile acid:sodium symporter family protein [Staphylococcus massiliensis]PNZ99474.1 bile acid:sodium symporter family protein [Staphylococcus massiliensis CCUG 55927]